MPSLVNEFFKIAQNYSDLLEDTEWGESHRSTFESLVSSGLGYSDLLEDTDWA